MTFLSQLWDARFQVYTGLSVALGTAQTAGWHPPIWIVAMFAGLGAALGVHLGGQAVQARRFLFSHRAMDRSTWIYIVTPELWRGPQPTATDYDYFQKHGIKTIIDLEWENHEADPRFQVFNIPCHPWHPEDEDALAFLQAVTNPANQPVFVHCKQGVDRTGMMVAVYRMVVQGWTNDAAYAEMKAMGFHAFWWWWSIGRYVKNFNAADPKWTAFRKANP
jgi:protein tyrosine/serine phosphatase